MLSGIALVLLLGSLYLTTLLPGIGHSGDTAGFQFIGRVWGIPHPTGYPAYIVLNHVFERLVPIGSHAWRANLLSAVFAVAACVVLRRFLARIGVRDWPAFTAALTFGVMRGFWSQAIVAEVYTLHILFLVLVIDRLAAWQQSRRRRDFLLAAAIYALSFGNHLTMILFLPAFAAFAGSVDRRIFRDWRAIAWTAVFVLAGMLQYGYLFWRSGDPALRYSEMPPGGFGDVVSYVTGGTFRSRMFSVPLSEMAGNRVPYFLKMFAREILWLLLLAGVGIRRLGNRPLQVLLGVLFTATVVYAIGYDVDDVWVFLLPAFLVLAIYAAVGLDGCARLVEKKAGQIATAALLLLLPVSFILFNYQKVDRSRDTESATAVEAALHRLDRNALVLSPKAMVSEFFWYYLIGEGWDKRNIHLVHHVNARQIAAYLNEGRTFALPEERRAVPVGLPVFDWEGSHRAELEGAGLLLSPAGENLYQVTAR